MFQKIPPNRVPGSPVHSAVLNLHSTLLDRQGMGIGVGTEVLMKTDQGSDLRPAVDHFSATSRAIEGLTVRTELHAAQTPDGGLENPYAVWMKVGLESDSVRRELAKVLEGELTVFGVGGLLEVDEISVVHTDGNNDEVLVRFSSEPDSLSNRVLVASTPSEVVNAIAKFVAERLPEIR